MMKVYDYKYNYSIKKNLQDRQQPLKLSNFINNFKNIYFLKL